MKAGLIANHAAGLEAQSAASHSHTGPRRSAGASGVRIAAASTDITRGFQLSTSCPRFSEGQISVFVLPVLCYAIGESVVAGLRLKGELSVSSIAHGIAVVLKRRGDSVHGFKLLDVEDRSFACCSCLTAAFLVVFVVRQAERHLNVGVTE